MKGGVSPLVGGHSTLGGGKPALLTEHFKTEALTPIHKLAAC